MMTAPKAFVSYSHDSQDHKLWVVELATRLMDNGVDVLLDQWELNVGGDLPMFMERSIVAADFILLVCTNNYVEKANSGSGGVGYEKMIVSSELLSGIDSEKILPIIRQSGTANRPNFIKTKIFVDMSSPEGEEVGLDELLRVMHETPVFKKPQLGVNPFESGDQPARRIVEPTIDREVEMLFLMAEVHEKYRDRMILREKFHESTKISKIQTDYFLNKLKDKKLIRESLVMGGDVYLSLTEKGIAHIIENKISDEFL